MTHWIRWEKPGTARRPGLESEADTRMRTSMEMDKNVVTDMKWVDATGYCSVGP